MKSPSEDAGGGSGRGINFTMFLTMMSERLFEFDTEPELIEAFESFDENDSGMVKVEDMRKWLREMADRMDDREVSRFVLDIYWELVG
jgi:myosin regulatory light chain 12